MATDQEILQNYINDLHSTLDLLPKETIHSIVEVLRQARDHHRHVFTFGNGSSSGLADVLGVAYGKGVLRKTRLPGRPALRLISLASNMPLFSAWANDSAYELVFSEQLLTLGDAGDVAIGISASGNSPNVVKGLQTAREMGMTTIGWTGFDGGRMKDACDICLIAPSNDMEQIEDIHMIFNHIILHTLREG